MRRKVIRIATSGLAVAILAATTATTVAAQVYEYRGEDGVMVYTDRPRHAALAPDAIVADNTIVSDHTLAAASSPAEAADEDQEHNEDAPATGKSFLGGD